MCVYFGLWSANHPIVPLLGIMKLWGDGITTPSCILFTLSYYISFLQVYTMANMRDDVEDEIIDAYMGLLFYMIPTSTTIT